MVRPVESKPRISPEWVPRNRSRTTLVIFTERGRTTAQALRDGHRQLVRQLFAGLRVDVFNGFDVGLLLVRILLRGVLAAQEPRTRS
jgi:hypothetical protein